MHSNKSQNGSFQKHLFLEYIENSCGGTILYICVMSIIGLSTSSFGMMEERESNQHYTPSKLSFVQPEKTSIKDFIFYSNSLPKSEESNYDKKLTSIHGKNLSSFPLSEDMYKFIVSKVGLENKKPFVFKTGPQIIFEDEIDLLK